MKDGNERKFDKIVSYLKEFWWKYVIMIFSISIIVLFVTSIVYDKILTLNVINSWVGIILGMIALVIGVISMFLSFYNLDQSINAQKETLRSMEDLKKEIISKIDLSFKETRDAVEKNIGNNVTREKVVNTNDFSKISMTGVNTNDKI